MDDDELRINEWINELRARNAPDYVARKAAEADCKRQEIINEVARTASPHDDIDFLTKRELHKARLISASELHATGSPELLPRGWYEYWVEALRTYCPARVFSLEEAGADAANLYDQGFRWMIMFSKATGPRGDRTFIDVQSAAAIEMTATGQWEESTSLAGIELMLGFKIANLPKDVFMTPQLATSTRAPVPDALQPPTPLPPQGWYADPAQHFERRWWDGQRWTHHAATNNQTFNDPM